MKHTLIAVILFSTLASSALMAAGGDNGSIDGAGITLVLEEIPASPLSPVEKEGILYMREEEKLARDVYNYLYEMWQVPVFRNIARSEQTHMDATTYILSRYNLPDPVADDTPGIFSNPELKELYDSLTAAGGTSLEAALAVGVEIEDLDIYDLGSRLALTDNADIRIVYLNLEKGSRNHLRSFYGQLLRRGGSYEARYISDLYFTRITESPGERGGTISDPNFIF